jgi:hypothetical protein
MVKGKRRLATLWEVSDGLWERIDPLLKQLDPPAGKGRKREDRRRVLDGITPHLRWVQVSFECGRAVNGVKPRINWVSRKVCDHRVASPDTVSNSSGLVSL